MSPRAARRRGIALHPRTASADGSGVRFADGSTGGASHPPPACTSSASPWQHTRGSALLGFVGHDAAHLVRAIAARAGRPGRSRGDAPQGRHRERAA